MTNQRASELAERLEQGANGLVAFAATLSPAEWHLRLPGDTRRIGTVVHHVASVYPIEIQLALSVAAGSPIAGLTMDDVHKMNAKHAEEWEQVSQEVALHLLRRNSADAAQAIRGPQRCPARHSRPRSRCTTTRRSRASSCSRITPSATATTISPPSVAP